MIYLSKSEQSELQQQLNDAKTSDSENVYRGGSVYEQIKTEFHEKCYICEDNEVTSIQIEHFNPHKGDLNKKYDWNNLFYSCGHCNNLKGHTLWPLLNCTVKEDRIWESLELKFSPFPKPKVEIIIHTEQGREVECENSKILLEKSLCGIGTTPMKTDEARNIRKKMLRVYNFVNTAITAGDMDNVKSSILDSAPFSGMIRWHLKNEYPSIYSDIA